MTEVYTLLDRNVILDKQDNKLYIQFNDEDIYKKEESADDDFENYRIQEWIKYRDNTDFNAILNRNFGENNYTHYDDYSTYERDNYLWVLISN